MSGGLDSREYTPPAHNRLMRRAALIATRCDLDYALRNGSDFAGLL